MIAALSDALDNCGDGCDSIHPDNSSSDDDNAVDDKDDELKDFQLDLVATSLVVVVGVVPMSYTDFNIIIIN